MLANSYGKFPKRPDIFIRDKAKARIFDVAIVADENLTKAYANKIAKYKILAKKLQDYQKIKDIKIIPVIITTSGLINKLSVLDLQKEQIHINWTKIVKDMVIRNMQDIMRYNGSSEYRNIEEIEEMDNEEDSEDMWD